MARIHRKSMMVYGRLQADFIGTEDKFISVAMMHILPGNIIANIV